MPLFAWKNEYTVNSEELDRHHQKLFYILNSLYGNIMNSTDVDNVVPRLTELAAYTSYHFAAEEQLMEEKGFPDRDAHIAKHREFTDSIETLRRHYHDNDLEVTRDLIIVLGEWLLRHVLREDKKYAGL